MPRTTILRSTTLLLLTGLLVCFTVFTALLLTSSLSVRTKTPASLLHQDSTIALFHHPTQKLINALLPFVPVLQDVPKPSSISALAVVEIEGKRGWIAFYRSTPAQAEIGPFALEASSALFHSAVQEQEHSLENLSAYKRLARTQKTDSSWGFWNLSTHTHNAFTVLAKKHCNAVKFLHKDVLHIECSPIFLPASKRAGALHQNPFPIPVVALSLADGKHALQNLLHTLPKEDVTILQSALSYATQERIASSASLSEHITPLLQNQVAFYAGRRTATGSVHIVVSGSHESAMQAQKELGFVADAFVKRIPVVHTQSYVFDDRFHVEELVRDRAGIQDNSTTIRGWHVRTIQSSTLEHELAVAQKGKEFLLSTDARALEAFVLGTKKHTASPLQNTYLQAYIDLTRFQNWLPLPLLIKLQSITTPQELPEGMWDIAIGSRDDVWVMELNSQ